jgi:Ca2+-binding RTX toxin-like protein
VIRFGTRTSGIDLLIGTGENDLLCGYFPGEESTDTSTDHIYGYVGYDTLMGGRGDDYLHGGSEDDVLIGGAGADHLYGDDGYHDCASYESSPAGVSIDLIWGTGRGGDAQDDTLYEIEDVVGSNFADGITGNNLANYLEGRAGNDTIYGNGGSDLIYGEGDNDTLVGGTGNDYLYGGSGIDHLFGDDDYILSPDDNDHLYGGDDTDYLWGGRGTDFLYGDDGDDTMCGGLGTDYLYGGNNSDWMFGDTYLMGSSEVDTSRDHLYGDGGDDHLFGGNGSDFLYGNADNDSLLGEAGDDVLLGDQGSDFLVGGSGRDEMRGDFGGVWTDTFIFESTSDFVGTAAAHTCDLIGDFISGVDKIDLHLIDASTVLDGNNGFLWRGTGAFNTSPNGEIRYGTEVDPGTHERYAVIYGDTDSDTAAEFQIEVRGTSYLELWDFNF